MPIKSLKDHLRHSSITVTLDRYSPLYPETRSHMATVLDDPIAGVESRTESNTGGPDADQTVVGGNVSALGWNRTSDTRFRKPVLYPLSYEGVREA